MIQYTRGELIMKKTNILLLLISTLLISCQNNTPTVQPTETPTMEPTETPTVEPTETPTVEPSVEPTVEPTIEPTEIPTVEPTIEPTQEPTVNLDVMNEIAFRLSSIYDIASDSGITTYKMYSPYNDTYSLKCNDATSITVYDEYKRVIASSDTKVSVNLVKNQIIYVSIEIPAQTDFKLFTTATNNLIELPYEINSSVDLSSLQTYSDSKDDPLKASVISYTKRNDGKGLYVNCNNPEKITEKEFNTVLTSQDVTDKEVFFTFEHNNANTRYYYYGYRVTNTDDHDIFVTVKNLGYQVSGAGSWLGEDEWIKFYNTKFESDTSSYTASQLSNYQAYVSFSNQYKSNNRKPVTYRIPAGQYIYVMGGTVADSYNKISVFDSANKKVKGGCGNGAVLFDVSGGNALGSFLVYTDPNASTVNESEYVKNNTDYGYIVTRDGVNVGSQYTGYDNCHGVVDADLCWTFNDSTPSQNLPVTYTNPYYTTQQSGTPYSKISNFIVQENKNVKEWLTHINPNHNSDTVGTDMTDYITVDHLTKQAITLGAQYFDGRGKNANIGNWMVDYIDTITLVNQGDKPRTFTYQLTHSGVILAFVRDENGFVDESYTPSYCTKISASEYGDAIDDRFKYTVEIAPHSIKRFSVNYNLLANSYGCIRHKATLK